MSKPISLLLTPSEEQAVNSFVQRLLDRYPDRIRQVVLFGSKARGDSGIESDIDILSCFSALPGRIGRRREGLQGRHRSLQGHVVTDLPYSSW